MHERENVLPQNKYDDLTGTRSRKRGPRGPYKKLNPLEERGKQPKEYNVHKAFWRRNTMDQVIELSGEELDQVIDAFFVEYEKVQQKSNKHWWYPEVIRMKDMRHIDIARKK